MELFGIAAMLLVMSLLIISIYYVHRTHNHKERMAMLKKGIDPKEVIEETFKRETFRSGILALTTGIGFVGGILLEQSNFFASGIEMPLYFAPILISGGIGLLISSRVLNRK